MHAYKCKKPAQRIVFALVRTLFCCQRSGARVSRPSGRYIWHPFGRAATRHQRVGRVSPSKVFLLSSH
jgi:hypothetical protein